MTGSVLPHQCESLTMCQAPQADAQPGFVADEPITWMAVVALSECRFRKLLTDLV